MKKYLVLVFAVVVLAVPNYSSATTYDDLQEQIKVLLQQVQALQAQLKALQGGTSATWCHTFNVNLRLGDSNQEVAYLQTALSKEGFTASNVGEKDGVFSETTASAVVGFQQKYKSEILTPVGLSYGTGYVGPSTRSKLNSLYGCGVTPEPIVCIQVITPAINSTTGECKNFPTPCDVPAGWIKTGSCPVPTPTSTPSIVVTFPKGGEILKAGTNYTIKWSSANIPSQLGIDIFLVDPTSADNSNPIAQNLSNTGNYTWSIPSEIKGGYLSGAQYKILIMTHDCCKPTAAGESGLFSIISAPVSSKINITTVSSGVLCRPTGQEYSATVTCPNNTVLVDCGLDETTGQPWSHTDSSFYANANSGAQSAYWVSRAKDGSNSCQLRIKTNQEGLCATNGTYWNLRAFCTPDIKKETVTTTSTGIMCSANGQEYSNTITCPTGTELISCGVDETEGQPWTHTDSAFFADIGSGQWSSYWTSRAKTGTNSCQFRIKSSQEALCPEGKYHWNLRAFCAPLSPTGTVSKNISCVANGDEYSGTVSCPTGSTLINCGIDETTGQPWTHTDSAFFADLGGSGKFTSYWVSRAKDGSDKCQFRIKTNEAGFCSSAWTLRAFCSSPSSSVASLENTSTSQLANVLESVKSVLRNLFNFLNN